VSASASGIAVQRSGGALDWGRRCASIERVDRSGICGVGLDLSIMVVLHVVFIRMRVVMDLQTVAAAGLRGSRDQATAPA
jgi:hypothetical protein